MKRIATLIPMRREVPTGRGYKWRAGYLVSFEGKEYHPPMQRWEAYEFARSLGANKFEVKK